MSESEDALMDLLFLGLMAKSGEKKGMLQY
jgi:hypothetical protein